MSKFPEQSLVNIADLPLDMRHAIILGWLNTLTTIYEKTAAQRDELLTICEEAHALLYHYDLVRQSAPFGVDWGPVEALRQNMINHLWQAIQKARGDA